MSDFLGRLTARHAESSTSPIVPRAVSRFQAPSLPVEQGVVEPVVAETSSRVPRSVEASRVSFGRDTPIDGPMTERIVRDEKKKARNRSSRSAMPLKVRVEQIMKSVETIVNATRVESRTERTREQPIVATPVVPRIVPNVEPREQTRGAMSAAHSQRDQSEQTIVRVHIGRIEVRGTPHRQNGHVRAQRRRPRPPEPTVARAISERQGARVSNALAIASVTAVLKDLLNNGVIDHQLSGVVGEVTVSALPPDRLLVAGEQETSRINLFMYHVTPNPGWRNVGLPSRQRRVEIGSRILHGARPSLFARQLRRERIPHGNSPRVRDAVAARESGFVARSDSPDTRASFAGERASSTDAAEHAHRVRACRSGRNEFAHAKTMSPDDISKLWMAIQSHYRADGGRTRRPSC